MVLHYPRLDTILMVEEVLKGASEPISKNELIRRLPRKVMWQTLVVILDYLEERDLIRVEKGVQWIKPKTLLKKRRGKHYLTC